ECLSPSNRKGRVKDLLADYALIAVPEVWLIEPKERTLRVFRDQEVAAQHSGTALAKSPYLGVSVSLKRLWRAFDEGL
ncbi:MAG: Uma2 family endonuclease, partial [Acidobacteria bacterium]|nr:Uma2 family endonuclease [Acidobacteriota bacterium]